VSRRWIGILVLLLAAGPLRAQLAKSYKLDAVAASAIPRSNVINDIVPWKDTLWFATEHGVSATGTAGASWREFSGPGTPDEKSISAITINDSLLWVATAYTFRQGDQSLPAGGGFYSTTDRGAHWSFIPQPVDEGLVDTIWDYGATGIRSLAITTEANNITYDLAVTKGTIWAANFAGMLRKSTNGGTTWQKVVLPPDTGQDFITSTDTLRFDLAPTGGKAGLHGNLNHRVFSVFASNDSTIWVGTAGGINKTTDGGRSWRKFSRQNQSQPISGNFVVAIKEQVWNGRRVLWAASVNAEAADEVRGVSYTDDGGATWKTALLGEFAHNIAVHDSVVYVATDRGVFRSTDFGVSWLRSGTVLDPGSRAQFVGSQLYAVAASGDTIWIGGPEGIAFTVDRATEPFGGQWRVFRAYQPLPGTGQSYAYPNPFSPSQEVVRLHYRIDSDALVTVRIFDFGMMPVRLLLNKAARQGGREWDEIWDGRNDAGGRVANGVYFYRIESGGGDPLWGKIMVLQ